VRASSAAAVTAALAECWIWRESKTYESSERDEGSKKSESVHNLSFPVERALSSVSFERGGALSIAGSMNQQGPLESDSSRCRANPRY
jgi:hypothetical protein